MSDLLLSLFDPDTLDAQRANPWREPHWDLVRQLISPGVNLAAIAALLEIAGASPEQVAYFSGPIVVHHLGGDHVPDQLALAIRLERFDAVREECAAGIIGDLAVPSDLAALLMTASLAAPLAAEYADIFIWATHTTVGRHGWTARPDDVPLPDYERIRSTAEALARNIRRKVVAVAKPATRRRRRPAQPDAVTELFLPDGT